MPIQPPDPDDDLLTPREAAELLGVRTTTIARWARQGRLSPLLTPGGHRRYTRGSVRAILESETSEEDRAMAEDAAHLYHQGWSIRQVADRFGCGYGVMRRILRKQITLRTRDGRDPRFPGQPPTRNASTTSIGESDRGSDHLVRLRVDRRHVT